MTDPVALPAIVGKAFEIAGKQAYAELMKRRMENARRILVRRLQRGQMWAIADDDAASSLFTFLRAAEEGTARRNLELIADLLANSAAEPEFAPNEFRRHARHLAELSYHEALALAVMVKAADLITEPENPWMPVLEHALGTGWFRDAEHFTASCTGLVRTGWIMPASLFDLTGYQATSALQNVARLIDIEEAIQRAEAEGHEP